MARHLIQNAATGESRIVGDAALPFFPGFVVLDTLDDGLPPFTFPTIGEADLRYLNVAELDDPESPGSLLLKAALDSMVADRGPFSQRPTDGAVALYQQTDAAGGFLAGTVHRWNGATWDIFGASTPQLSAVGTQGNTWISPDNYLTGVVPAGANLVCGAGGVYMRLIRPSKDIHVSSLGVAFGSTAGNYTLGLYRVDGLTLTRIATTAQLALPGVANTFRRDPIQGPAVLLQAGNSYYIAISSDVAASTLAWTGYRYQNDFIGTSLGDNLIAFRSGPGYFPLPAAIDTVTEPLTVNNHANAGVYHLMAAHSAA